MGFNGIQATNPLVIQQCAMENGQFTVIFVAKTVFYNSYVLC